MPAALARYGQKMLVLDIEELGEHAAGGAHLVHLDPSVA